MNSSIYLNTQGKHSLFINGKDVLLHTDFSVISLFVFPHETVIITDDPDLHGTSIVDSYRDSRTGNITAFDTQGEILWKYNDISPDPLHFPFCGGYVANKESKSFFTKWFHLTFDPDHTYLVAIDYADGHTIIDITDRQWIARVTYRS